MGNLTVALINESDSRTTALIESLAANINVERLLLIGQTGDQSALSSQAQQKSRALMIGSPRGASLAEVLDAVETDYVLFFMPGEHVGFGQHSIERFLSVAEDSGAGLIYSDFKDEVDHQLSDHPLIDYQLGSIRDNFDFGPAMLVSRRAAAAALSNHGPI